MTPSYQIISGATTAFVICISYTLQVATTSISLVRRLAKTVPALFCLDIIFLGSFTISTAQAFNEFIFSDFPEYSFFF